MTGALRTSLAGFTAYMPDAGVVEVDLSDNTNRWGSPPAAVEAMRANLPSLAQYPDAYAQPLKDAVSAYLCVSAEQVVTGCGSDDVLDSALRAFANPGDRVAIATPTFPMVARFAVLNSLVPVEVPLTPSYDADVDALLAPNPRVVYVCSPNNPTGTLVSRATLKRLASRLDGVLIVDEAYAEFAGVSAVDLAASLGNVLVVRTMSKAFGLAGLRVGFAVGSRALVREVEKSRGPFKVTSVGIAAATAALRDGIAWMTEHVGRAVRVRERLDAELRARSLAPVPSSANFVCVPVRDAMRIAAGMRARGVAVRAYSALPRISDALMATNGDALRITAGPWSEMQLALDALDAELSGCA